MAGNTKQPPHSCLIALGVSRSTTMSTPNFPLLSLWDDQSQYPIWSTARRLEPMVPLIYKDWFATTEDGSAHWLKTILESAHTSNLCAELTSKLAITAKKMEILLNTVLFQHPAKELISTHLFNAHVTPDQLLHWLTNFQINSYDTHPESDNGSSLLAYWNHEIGRLKSPSTSAIPAPAKVNWLGNQLVLSDGYTINLTANGGTDTTPTTASSSTTSTETIPSMTCSSVLTDTPTKSPLKEDLLNSPHDIYGSQATVLRPNGTIGKKLVKRRLFFDESTPTHTSINMEQDHAEPNTKSPKGCNHHWMYDELDTFKYCTECCAYHEFTE